MKTVRVTNNAHWRKMRELFILLLFNVITIIHVARSLRSPSQLQCKLNMSSTCPDHDITQWNKKHVGKNLKEWIKSINIEWKYDEYVASGHHCKVFLKLKNDVFETYAPGAFDPDILMLGKVESNLKIFEYEKHRRIDNSRKPRLHGPIWADLNNRHEWIIIQSHQGVSVKLSDDAILGNGLYYGVLGGYEMKLGYKHDLIYYC